MLKSPRKYGEPKLYVYVIGAENGPFKIGVAKDVKRRLALLQTGSYSKIYIHAVKKCDDRAHAYSVEAAAHKALSEMRMTGEWFSCALADALSAADAELSSTSRADSNDAGLAYFKNQSQAALDYLAKYHGLESATAEAINAHLAAKAKSVK